MTTSADQAPQPPARGFQVVLDLIGNLPWDEPIEPDSPVGVSVTSLDDNLPTHWVMSRTAAMLLIDRVQPSHNTRIVVVEAVQ